MKQKIIGVYEMGYNHIQIVLREGTGGEFYMMPEKGKVARIKVGADQEHWFEVVNCFLHEAMELEYERMNCRFQHGGFIGKDMADFIFVATHPQFTETVARVAELVSSSALSDLNKAWRTWKREAKAREKK